MSKQNRPKAIRAWALVRGARIVSVEVQAMKPWGYGMDAVRVEIRPVPVKRRKARRKA